MSKGFWGNARDFEQADKDFRAAKARRDVGGMQDAHRRGKSADAASRNSCGKSSTMLLLLCTASVLFVRRWRRV